jgi:hypothetical protein
LQKHKQDVSEAYIFNRTPNQRDYEFLKKNVNFQFFINDGLFTASNGLYTISTQTSASKIELHIKNKTTAEIDLDGNNLDIKKVTITYDDFLLTVVFNEYREIEYDFKTAVSETHYYALALDPYALGRDLEFYYSAESSIQLLLSPYD